MIIPSNSLNTNTHSCAFSHRVHNILNEILVPHSQHTHPHPPKITKIYGIFLTKLNANYTGDVMCWINPLYTGNYIIYAL